MAMSEVSNPEVSNPEDTVTATLTSEEAEAAPPPGEEAAAPAGEPAEAVTVTLLSGEAIELPGAGGAEAARELCRRLEERRPLGEGGGYQLLAGDRVLAPGDEVPRGSLSAVVVETSLLMRQVVGSYRRVFGDDYFLGLKIEKDGTYECNSGRVRDGLVHILCEDTREINLKRNTADAVDHHFIVSEGGGSLTGMCYRTGDRWLLFKES
mmetsp:Transcript_112017/g.327587  ORF Transcript_112017/g.327587 Transcript_112017/m.327587 type:complete len:209 (-) Transcript_112017:74-700(-)